jgi:hypothetical protein
MPPDGHAPPTPTLWFPGSNWCQLLYVVGLTVARNFLFSLMPWIFLYPPNVYRSSLVYDGRNWSELFWFVEIHIRNFHFIPRVSYSPICVSLYFPMAFGFCWTNRSVLVELKFFVQWNLNNTLQIQMFTDGLFWIILSVNLCVKHVNQVRNFC